MVDSGNGDMYRGGKVGSCRWGGATYGLGGAIGNECRTESAEMGEVEGAMVGCFGASVRKLERNVRCCWMIMESLNM